MIGRDLGERLLRELSGGGLLLSLHGGPPGDTGAGELPGAGRLRVTAAYLTVAGRAVVVTAEPPPLLSGAAGLVTHAGLWTVDGLWIDGGRLAVPASVAAGDPLTLLPGTVLLRWDEAR